MAEMQGPRCGNKNVHEPHTMHRLNMLCTGWTAEQNGVYSLLDAVRDFRASRVLSDDPTRPARLLCHPSVLAAIQRNVLPDYAEFERAPMAMPKVGVEVEIDTSQPPGYWQLIAAEGVVP